MASNDAVSSLKKAVEVSPDNVPLRVHLADTLQGVSRYEEAQKEYTTALALDPDNTQIKIGLAVTFYQLGKHMQALVIVEDLIAGSETPPGAFLLHARMLLNDGKIEQAVREYKRAIQLDPTLTDESLSDRLGVGAHHADSDVVDGRVRSQIDPGDDFDTEIEKSKIKFGDVGGMEDVKEQIRMKIIYPMTNPDVYKAYGKKMGGGILMYGPPGCGKTHLARATAGEINAGFISVGINEILDCWIGGSERNLHDIFESARRNTPVVLFFDEVDALAASRNTMKNNGGRQVINQFLAELDGVDTNNEGVLILAATNAPWHLDSAFRRPGRFDRIIFVPPPDKVARSEILRIMLEGKPTENIDYDYIAKKTDNFSGADMHSLVDHTLEKKIEQAMKEGKPKPITTKDLESNLKDVKPSTTEWFATAKNYALYSNEGGAYDEIRKYLKL
ncbi:MAG: AAA family ATPase [Candidatus Melainabacteria bacterium]|nr:AAA family ATPase [Candidatus Melainabacteria bacterium]